MKGKHYFSQIAYIIISHKIFDSLSILVIVVNCFFLALDDPTAKQANPIMEMSDYVFQALYTIEMLLKISGLGFALNKNSYLRDPWNILDFVIVVSGYATFFISSSSSDTGGSSTNISALRSFRVLRPLRTISGVEGLRVIVQTLMSAVPLLRDTILVLLFFFFIFAIAGVQLFQGILKNRCVHIETGIQHPDDEVCGNKVCPEDYFCGKRIESINYDVTNGDNILKAFLLIFQTVTLEGWSNILINFEKAIGVWAIFFFIPIIFVGSWFLLNLTLAVIKSRFSEEHSNKLKKKNKRKESSEEEQGSQQKIDQTENNDTQTNEEQEEQQNDNQDITSPELKRHLKNKLRIEKLLKRVDTIMKEKEIHDKMSPTLKRKKFNITQFVQNIRYNDFVNLEEDNSKTKRSLSNDNMADQSKEFKEKKINYINQYDEIFNSRLGGYNETIKQDTNEKTSQQIKEDQITDIFGEDLKFEIVDKDFNAIQQYTDSKIGKAKQKLNKIMPIFNKSCVQNNQQPQNHYGKVIMKDIFTISRIGKPRQLNNSQLDTTRKQELYDKLAQNDEIMKLFQSEHDEIDTKQESLASPKAMPQLNKSSKFNFRSEKIHQIRKLGVSIKEDNLITIDVKRTLSPNASSPFKKGKTLGVSQLKYEEENDKKVQKNSLKNKIKSFLTRKLKSNKEIQSFKTQIQKFSKTLSEKDQSEEPQTSLQLELPASFIGKSVKARSEERKKFLALKQQDEFKDREKLFQRKRNKFFSQSIKHIGKKQQEDKKQSKAEKIEQKRKIKLKGFEVIPMESYQTRRTLLRSGSTIGIKSIYEGKIIEHEIDDELRKELEIMKQSGKILKDNVNDSNIDMEEVLREQKKKIKVKNKYNFESENDIFEIRQQSYKYESKMPQEGQQENVGVQIEGQDPNLESINQEKQEKLRNKYRIKGYQKKINFQGKQNFDELVQQEAQSSDDDQDTVLKRLQDKHNEQYRSNIFVTGTLSIVINAHHHINKKMLNNDYFFNISRSNSIKPLRSQNSVQSNAILESQGQQNSGLSVSYISQSDKVGSERVLSQESPQQNSSSKRRKCKRITLQQQRGPQRKSSIRKSNIELISKSLSKSSNERNINKQSNNNQYRSELKPQILTDKQIIKNLNQAVQNSSIFRSNLNIHNLPQQISKNNIKISSNKSLKYQKLKNQKMVGQFHKKEEEEETDSEDELQNEENQEGDFFIDRDVNCQEEVQKAKVESICKPRDYIEWSGQDVMERYDPYKAIIALKLLNDIRVWPYGYFGYIKRFRVAIKNIMRSSLVENLLTMCVAVNTIILTLDHYGIEEKTSAILSSFNKAFTIIFALEMGLKILSVGIKKYVADKMNYLDGGVVVLSLIEVAFMSGGGTFSAFRAVRIFRTFRVLRVARLLKSMKSMMNIIAVIQTSITSFAYLSLLLFLFVFIYALLGMQLFGGKFNFEEGIPRNNFDSFNSAFVTSFIILTMENWQIIMFNAMRSNVHFIIVQLYFISWIFIGNYMLLNLFLSVLLDSFSKIEEEDHETIQKSIKREQKRIEDLQKKSGEEMITEMSIMQNSSVQKSNHKSNKKKKNQKKKKQKQIDNIFDESVELDYETLSQIQQEEKESKGMFDDIECEISFFIFSQQNKIRILCFKLTNHKYFENTILVLIVLSSFKLIFDTYLTNVEPTNTIIIISDKLDYFFTISFALESLLKSISLGLMLHKNSYLRDTWSQLDFFIVITSIIDATATNVNLPIIKILRLLRILRPLRFVSHNSSMKNLIIALLQSMGGILNVFIVVCLIFLVFAILGVNMFGGKFQYCDIDTYIARNKRECTHLYNGNWLTYDLNFDNAIISMLTLFIMANQEGWPGIMNIAIDNNGLEQGPKENASPSSAYFFLIFVFVGSFFFMNLFIGVLFMNFEAAGREEKETLLLEHKELQWIDMMRMIVTTKPEIIKVSKNKIRNWAYRFTQPETKFDFTIMICIILNMLLMALSYEGQSYSYTKTLENINYFFTFIFALEATLKIIGQGFYYFSNTWNKFDFFVVLSSFLDIIMGSIQGQSLKFLRIGPQLARVLRVLRVTRLFRLLNKYRGLQALIQTIMFSLPSLLNVLALLMLVFFIYAVLGVFLFGNIAQGIIINEYMNFQNFGMAMITLLRISTGEQWSTIMYDTMNTNSDCIPGVNCGTSIAPLYFITFILICNYIMLNLFILVILQQFQTYYVPSDNILQKFRDDLVHFKNSWNKFSKEYEGLKIRSKDLVPFSKDLKGNLKINLDKGETELVILRNIVKMNLESDEQGFIYFNELLYKTMKRIYGFDRTKKKQLANQEFQAQQKLKLLEEKMMKKSRYNERSKIGTVNPFLTVMFKHISFKLWLTEYKKNKEKRLDEQELQMDRESSDEDLEEEQQIDQYEILDDVTIYSEYSQDNEELDNQSEINANYDQEGGFKIKLLQTERSESSSSILKFQQKSTIKRNLTINSYKFNNSVKEEEEDIASNYNSQQPLN